MPVTTLTWLDDLMGGAALLSGLDRTWGYLPGGATLLTARRTATTVTSGTADIFTWTIAEAAVSSIDVVILARDPAAANGARFNLAHAFQRHLAAAPVAYGSAISASPVGSAAGAPPAGYIVTIDNSGNTGRVRCTGPAASVNWIALVQLLVTPAA